MVQFQLTRLTLDPLSSAALKVARNGETLHRFVYTLFPVGDRPLFRLDSEAAPERIHALELLIQSKSQPDLARIDSKLLAEPPASKQVQIQLSEHQILAFRLLARPSRTIYDEAAKKNKRRDLRTDGERLDWLNRIGEKHGFRLVECEIATPSFALNKPETGPKGKGESFAAALFNGRLQVERPADLEALLAAGVGQQKAFGFGLLSLRRG